MGTSYVMMMPMDRPGFDLFTETDLREFLTWSITERVIWLGWTPVDGSVICRWWEMDTAEAAVHTRGHPGFAYQAGDMVLHVRITVAEDVPAGSPP